MFYRQTPDKGSCVSWAEGCLSSPLSLRVLDSLVITIRWNYGLRNTGAPSPFTLLSHACPVVSRWSPHCALPAHVIFKQPKASPPRAGWLPGCCDRWLVTCRWAVACTITCGTEGVTCPDLSRCSPQIRGCRRMASPNHDAPTALGVLMGKGEVFLTCIEALKVWFLNKGPKSPFSQGFPDVVPCGWCALCVPRAHRSWHSWRRQTTAYVSLWLPFRGKVHLQEVDLRVPHISLA